MIRVRYIKNAECTCCDKPYERVAKKELPSTTPKIFLVLATGSQQSPTSCDSTLRNVVVSVFFTRPASAVSVSKESRRKHV